MLLLALLLAGAQSPAQATTQAIAGASTQSPAQEVNWAEVHNATMRGIDRLYNLDVDGALATFDTVARMAPLDPRGPFFRSMVHSLLYTLQRDEQEYERFLALSDDVIGLCEKLLDKDDNDANAHFYLGGIYGYRGLAHQSHGSLLKAVYDGRKGYLHLEDAVRIDPTLFDAQMGFGLFRYLLGKAPRSLGVVLKLLGLSGDTEAGLAMLQRAAEKGVYTRTEARYFLAIFLFNEDRRDEAYGYLNGLIARYPHNTLFLLQSATWQNRMGNYDEALALARRAVDLNTKQAVKYGTELAYSTLANAAFGMNDFATARENFEAYVNRALNRVVITNMAWYRLGVSREMLGDRQGAVEAYRQARETSDETRPWDPYYYRLTRVRLDRPLGEVDHLLLRAGNDASRRKNDQALAEYEQVLSLAGNDVDARAGALYGLLQIHAARDSGAAALRVATELLKLEPPRERWLLPHAWFRVGQIYAKMGRTADAEKAFETAADFDNYDFQFSLEPRIASEQRKLKASAGRS